MFPDAAECIDTEVGGGGLGPVQKDKRHMRGVVTHMSKAIGHGASDTIRMLPPLNILVDSRERNRSGFVNAADFTLSMNQLNGVKKLVLNQIRFPIKAPAGGIDPYSYAILCVEPGNVCFMQPLAPMTVQFPSSVLAVIPMIPDTAAGTHVSYRKTSGDGQYAVHFPGGVSFNRLRIQLMTYLATDPAPPPPAPPIPSGTCIPYPFTDEPAAGYCSHTNNYFLSLEIEYEARKS